MKSVRFLSTLCALSCMLLTNGIAADTYEVGDTLYVWANNGLRLHEEPNACTFLRGALPFSASIIVIAKTDKAINIMGISLVDTLMLKRPDPVIFYGKWVKVRTTEGDTGYVADQYLLDIKPAENPRLSLTPLNIEILSIDTISKSPPDQYTDLFITVKYHHARQIQISMNYNEKGHSGTYEFPGFSMEEVLIILGSSWNEFTRITVERNWANRIDLSENSLCELSLRSDKNGVRLFVSCACC